MEEQREDDLHELIAKATKAVEEGADIDHPAIQALVPHIRMIYDLDRYRVARRGLGLTTRQARERVERLTAYSEVSRELDGRRARESSTPPPGR